MAYSDGHPVVTCVSGLRRDVPEGKGAGACASKPGSPRDLHFLRVSCRSCSFSLRSQQNMADQNLEKHPKTSQRWASKCQFLVPPQQHLQKDGRKASEKQANSLQAHGIVCFRVHCGLPSEASTMAHKSTSSAIPPKTSGGLGVLNMSLV